MLPSFATQLHVYRAPKPVVYQRPGIDPCVDDQTRARLERVVLAHRIRRMQGIEQRRNGDLGRRIPRTRAHVRRGRVDGHAGVVDETHGGGGLRQDAPSTMVCIYVNQCRAVKMQLRCAQEVILLAVMQNERVSSGL